MSKTTPAAWLKPGTTFTCEMARNACDDYDFVVASSTDDVMTVAWSMRGASDKGQLRFPKAVLDGGQGSLFISQGSVEAGMDFLRNDASECATHAPSFMVPRSVVAALRAKKSVPYSISDATGTLSLVGTEPVTLTVDGATVSVNALKADAGDGGRGPTLLILDDDTLPLLLKADFSWGNTVELKSITSR